MHCTCAQLALSAFCYIYKWFRAHVLYTLTHTRTAVATICNCSAFINVARSSFRAAGWLLPWLFPFPFYIFPFSLCMLKMFTRSTTFCWSSTNHQAFCLAPRSCLLISDVFVLRFLFDMLIWLYLICASPFFLSSFCWKTCSHAVLLNFNSSFCCFSQLTYFKNA